MAEEKFCSVEQYSVLIPYRDLERMTEMAKKVEHIEEQYVRLQEQYTCIRGMFSECLENIKEIRAFVRDT